jgi:hypothetical protein
LAVDGKMSLVTDAVATTNIADSAVTAAKLGTLMTNALVFATNSAGNVVGLYFTNGILRAAKVP